MKQVPPPTIVVIIAAGMGSRLKSDQGPPKPLLPLGGKPLIIRVLERFRQAGIKKAVVVTGYRAEEVEAGVKGADLSMDITFCRNDNYRQSNGLSVLAAQQAVGNNSFFLSMADHIFDQSLIDRLFNAELPEGGLVLAVDRKLDRIYDEDDATKVLTSNGKIVQINKVLPEFDAVDTGLFACTPALFEHIEEARSRHPEGDCSLSDGVKALASTGRALVHDIGDGRWQDVDTPGAVTHAEKIFL